MQVWSSSERWGKTASYCSCPSFSSLNLHQVQLLSLSLSLSLSHIAPLRLSCPTRTTAPLPPSIFPWQSFDMHLSSISDAGWGQAYMGWLPTWYHEVFWQRSCGWATWPVLQCQHFKAVMFTCLWSLWWFGLFWVYSRWPPPLSSGSVSHLYVVGVRKSHWIYPKSHGI